MQSNQIQQKKKMKNEDNKPSNVMRMLSHEMKELCNW
jgi:hypothetical protein